ncbi:hypothetical protein [Variovorax terrae]|uniref:Uncharacterized protein n=1 Tax=Variovorax terrae TaxID=2923278 RepID=A0A9X2AMI4_9BURK|nr:hypothetical protein [Variovorax terrae]MCJ0763758.1 hypothetical protein [Variovorax terrae]
MSDLLAGMARLVLRLLLVAMGLVFAASLFVAVAVLACLWFLRALWARLTGRPVTPWVMRVDPRAGWSRFYQAGPRPPSASPAPAGGPVSGRTLQDVTDVEPKEPRG